MKKLTVARHFFISSAFTVGMFTALVGCEHHMAELGKTASVMPISERDRNEIDRIFFNEFSLRFQPSQRYGPDWHTERPAEFKRLAEQGYVPPKALLRLFGPNLREVRADRGAFDMLLEAANKGDVSSQCALYEAYRWSPISIPTNDIDRYVVMPTLAGLKKNHFMCHQWLALWHEQGLFGREKNPQRAKEYWLEAAKQGSVLAYQVHVQYDLSKHEKLDPLIIERSLCWSALAVSSAGPNQFIAVFSTPSFAAAGHHPRVTDANDQRILGDLVKKWVLDKRRGIPKATTVDECIELERRGAE